MADITIVNGVYKQTYNLGAPSCVDLGKNEEWPMGELYKTLWKPNKNEDLAMKTESSASNIVDVSPLFRGM